MSSKKVVLIVKDHEGLRLKFHNSIGLLNNHDIYGLDHIFRVIK